MPSSLEVAEVFRRYGCAWRAARVGKLSYGQLRVMSAIEDCRTSALGGHVEQCESCDHTRIAYNSCRNRHCPKCQWSSSERWLQARKAELLSVPYYHVVFTMPAAIGDIAYQNKSKVYGILFKAASKALLTIAADPKHLGAKIGVTSVLHTWGQSLQHHPHIHCIVPGGGIAVDKDGHQKWISCRPGFFLPVRVLSRLFRRLFLQYLLAAFDAGELRMFNALAELNDKTQFVHYLNPHRKTEWVVYAKRPFAGPEQVLTYLARYTHRVAIANSRLIAIKGGTVTFKWKDYRLSERRRPKCMTLVAAEFMRRFLLHVLPDRFHRIRHHGLLANGHRSSNVELCRQLLQSNHSNTDLSAGDDDQQTSIEKAMACPCCGGKMIVIEVIQHPYAKRMEDP